MPVLSLLELLWVKESAMGVEEELEVTMVGTNVKQRTRKGEVDW